MDVGSALEVRVLRNLLVSSGLVTDKADENVIRVAGILTEEFVLW